MQLDDLIDTLRGEVAGMAGDLDAAWAAIAAPGTAPDSRGAARDAYAEHLGRLGDTAALLGLTGLQEACARVL
ncbi:MAG TPA: hypothetical protein VF801_15000, partial [Rhodocyclaceae bacterium]